jgi:hypothetical protein
MDKTKEQFEKIITKCRTVFENKLKDYGTAWRILRLTSLADQIYIKANRIRNLQLNKERKVDEGIVPEFIGIVNYSVMALIQLDMGFVDQPDISNEKAVELYNKYIYQARDLMYNKNHDYGEAWRHMRISSLTDIILMKLLRIKEIENNDRKTLVSEGLDANYYDIINYSVFALIKLLLENETE